MFTRVITRNPPSVSVVIPALNEADNLPHVLPYLPDWVDEVLLVDGGSKDKTIEVAQTLWPGIKVIRQTGRGKGNALKDPHGKKGPKMRKRNSGWEGECKEQCSDYHDPFF